MFRYLFATLKLKRVLVQCSQRLCCQVLCRYLAPCVIYAFYFISLFLFFVPGEDNRQRNTFLFAACFLYQRQNACLSFERSKYVYILPATCYAPAVKHSRCGTTAFVKSFPKSVDIVAKTFTHINSSFEPKCSSILILLVWCHMYPCEK